MSPVVLLGIFEKLLRSRFSAPLSMPVQGVVWFSKTPCFGFVSSFEEWYSFFNYVAEH